MVRVIGIVIFLAIAGAICFGLHALVCRRLKRDLAASAAGRRVLSTVFWLLGTGLIAGMFFIRRFDVPVLRVLVFTWLGVIVTAFVIFLLEWPLVVLFPARARVLAAAALAVTVLLCGYELIMGNLAPVVRPFDIPLKKLPPQLDGFTIVQLSDLHLDGSGSEKPLAAIVERVNGLRPDLVVITGDLMEGDLAGGARFGAILKRLRAREGVLAVTGNHEGHADPGVFDGIMRDAGIRVLRDEAVTVAGGLRVAGLADGGGDSGGDPEKSPLGRALRGRDLQLPVILLKHRPTDFEEAAGQGVDFQISGHTHAGQFFPMAALVMAIYRYPYGLYRDHGATIYTSCGTGLWGPAMRFLSRNEIVRFRLRRE